MKKLLASLLLASSAAMANPLETPADITISSVVFAGCEIGFYGSRRSGITTMMNISNVSIYHFSDKQLKAYFRYSNLYDYDNVEHQLDLQVYQHLKRVFMERRAICSHSPYSK